MEKFHSNQFDIHQAMVDAMEMKRSVYFATLQGYVIFETELYIYLSNTIATIDKLQIKIKLRSFKSSTHINEKRDGPYRGFGYLSIFSDPLDLAKWSQSEILKYCNFKQETRYKDLYYPNKVKYIKRWLENESKR